MDLKQDRAEGLKWYHRAMEAGDGMAANHLGGCYYEGNGVEQDHDKAFEYFQTAAELGHIPGYYALGNLLMFKRGEIEEGMLNLRKAVMCGMSEPLKSLRYGFADGYITKDEYAFTLRENQAACNEIKSVGREEWILAQEYRR